MNWKVGDRFRNTRLRLNGEIARVGPGGVYVYYDGDPYVLGSGPNVGGSSYGHTPQGRPEHLISTKRLSGDLCSIEDLEKLESD